jgi:hypothetical protein
MKIIESKVVKIKVDDIYQSHGLDPLHIYLEDYELGKGKITISCCDKTWHSYWGGMGNRTICKFFLSCDNHYIAKNLSNIDSSISDFQELSKKIKEFYGDTIDYFVNDEMSALEGDQEDGKFWVQNNAKIMEEVFGCDWYYDIPTMENPQYNQYKYLCRIIDMTKEALTAR